MIRWDTINAITWDQTRSDENEPAEIESDQIGPGYNRRYDIRWYQMTDSDMIRWGQMKTDGMI